MRSNLSLSAPWGFGMPTYSKDPRWILTQRPGTCGKCYAEFPAGIRAFYYPITKKTYVADCAEAAARHFATSAHDEDAACAY